MQAGNIPTDGAMDMFGSHLARLDGPASQVTDGYVPFDLCVELIQEHPMMYIRRYIDSCSILFCSPIIFASSILSLSAVPSSKSRMQGHETAEFDWHMEKNLDEAFWPRSFGHPPFTWTAVCSWCLLPRAVRRVCTS